MLAESRTGIGPFRKSVERRNQADRRHRPERSIQHAAPVWWIAVSHDSQVVAVAGADGRATLYDPDDGKALRSFGEHEGGIYCAAFSPDDSLIATAGADGRSKIWDARKGRMKSALPQFGAVHAIAFSPDGRLLATGGADYAVRLWNVDGGVFRGKRTGHKDAVWTIAFDPKRSRLASAGGDGNICFWTSEDQPNRRLNELPRQVNLRPAFRKFELQIVAQGARNTCSVHTFARAMEFALSKRANRGIRLSDEYLNWACNQLIGNTGPITRDRGQFFEHLWMGYCKHGVCTAERMPFQRTFDSKVAPSAAATQEAAETAKYNFVWRDISGPGISDDSVVTEAKAVLARGLPLLAGSSHSLLVVGYIDQPRRGFFLVADSGTGTFIDKPTGDRLHSAIPFSRVRDYGFSWIECTGGSN